MEYSCVYEFLRLLLKSVVFAMLEKIGIVKSILENEDKKVNISRDFFNSVETLYNQNISTEVLKRAKRSLLDYLAGTSAGAKFQETKVKDYCTFAQP